MPAANGAQRPRQFPARPNRLNLRLNADEYHDIAAAAAAIGLTPTGFCADAALAVARGAGTRSDTSAGLTRTELTALQRELFATRTAVIRTGTNLNQAVAALNATGEAPAWLEHATRRCTRTLERLDQVSATLHRRLR